MLLSIDKVLLLLSEGKTIDKIAEMAESDSKSVIDLVHEARMIVMKARPELARKKVRLKAKKIDTFSVEERITEEELLQHADMTVVPVEQPFVIYAAVVSENEGHRYALLFLDNEGKQFGRLVEFCVLKTIDLAMMQALSQAILVARHFSASSITVRYDRDRLSDILSGRAIVSGKVAEAHEQLAVLVKQSNAKLELIDRSANEKGYHLLNLK